MPTTARHNPITLFILVGMLSGLLVGALLPSAEGWEAEVIPRAVTPAGPDIGLYRGLGSWVDIYDKPAWKNPTRTVRAMAARGVRTLYIETSNYQRERKIKFASKQREFIEAAHESGMKVVAWYLPGFKDLQRDLTRTLAAIRFRTSQGEAYDSFALDIEAPLVASPALRTRRLLHLSAAIRRAVGPRYALGAIIPSPRGMQTNPDYWPHFPYRALLRTYDVFLPMTYFTWRVSGREGAHTYTTFNIRLIRSGTGVRNVPIHVIGGIADEATADETAGFVHSLRENGALGGSYYTFPITRPVQWSSLRTIPANPRQRPALPVSLGYPRALGNIPGVDETHPKEVVYRTGPLRGPRALTFQAFDVQRGEVSLLINWRSIRHLSPTVGGTWGAPQTIRLPGSLLRRHGPNFIQFVASGGYPEWTVWGVQVQGLR
jgi:hypothetical protein